jgi:hypothetical protein
MKYPKVGPVELNRREYAAGGTSTLIGRLGAFARLTADLCMANENTLHISERVYLYGLCRTARDLIGYQAWTESDAERAAENEELLRDAIADFAPPLCYFERLGLTWGFWRHEPSILEALREGTLLDEDDPRGLSGAPEGVNYVLVPGKNGVLDLIDVKTKENLWRRE